MSSQDNDRSCMERVRAGDMRALEELYDRHNGLLYAVAHRVLGRAEDAEEIVAALPPQWVRFERFSGVGHGPWRDDPARAFAVLRRFVEEAACERH